METTVRVRQRDGQAYIPVPEHFLSSLAIKSGDNVSLYLEADGISLYPYLEPAAELQRILAGCTEQVVERDRENRYWLQMSLKGREH